MSTFLKILVVVVIIGGIGLAAYLGGYIPLQDSKKTAVQPAQTATTTPEQQAQQPIGGMTALREVSDGALAQDVGAIDTQIQNLTTDASSLDTSFTDKPVTQTY